MVAGIGNRALRDAVELVGNRTRNYYHGTAERTSDEPVILAELRLSRRFWLGAGYGLTIMPSVTVTNSIFDEPTPACASTMVNYEINNQSCKALANGTARPSANGTYTSLVQDFGLTFTFRL